MNLGDVAEVDGMETPTRLDAPLDSGDARVRLATEEAEPQGGRGGVVAEASRDLVQVEGDGGGGADHARTQALHEQELTLRIAAAHGQDLGADMLGRAQEAPAAHEKAQGKGDLDRVVGPQSRRPALHGLGLGDMRPVGSRD